MYVTLFLPFHPSPFLLFVLSSRLSPSASFHPLFTISTFPLVRLIYFFSHLLVNSSHSPFLPIHLLLILCYSAFFVLLRSSAFSISLSYFISYFLPAFLRIYFSFVFLRFLYILHLFLLPLHSTIYYNQYSQRISAF